MRGAEDARRRRSAAAIWRWAGNKFPREDSSERSRALPKPDGFVFPARRGPLDRRIAQRTTWQNGSTAGSHRPKRRWEAATHRKRVPAQRKAAAERQPSPPEIVSSSPPEGKAAHQQRCRPSRTPPSSSSMLLVYRPYEVVYITTPMEENICTPRARPL